jgi:hypothetical protein
MKTRMFEGAVVAAVVCAATLWTTRSEAYCNHGASFAVDKVPVYLRAGSESAWRHANGANWTVTQLAREIRWVTENMNNMLGSNMPPLYYAGTKSCADTNGDGQYFECRQANAVVITATAPGSGVCGAWSNGGANGVVIHLENSTDCQARFDQWLAPSGRSDLLTTMLYHEMGHGIGMAHPNECPIGPANPECDTASGICATMTCGWQQDVHCPDYYLDDALAVQAMYGVFQADGAIHRESTDGSTWFDLPYSAVPMELQWGADASVSGIEDMYVVSRDDSSRVDAFEWEWLPITWTDLSRASDWKQIGAVGAARSSAYRWGFFTAAETQSNVDKVVGFSRRSDGDSVYKSVNWSYTTRSQGTDGAYDPKSARIVQVSRNNLHQIVLQTLTGTSYNTAVTLQDAGTPIVSLTTPTLTCGPADIARNCMLMWVNAKPSQYHYAYYLQFSVTGASTFDFGSIASTGWVMYSRPQLAFAGSTAGGKFVMAFADAHTSSTTRHVSTAPKGTSESDVFSLVAHHDVTTRGHLHYVLGTSNDMVELIVTYQEPD